MEFEKKPETSYLVRDEAEKVSRDKGIPPERFSEFAKSGWKDIITKFCYTFLDMKKQRGSSLAYSWLNFREGLAHSEAVRCGADEFAYFARVRELIPEEDRDKKLFLILSQGWVYEGYAEEIFSLLPELFYLEDAYILSPKFRWVICHCDDGECAVFSAVKN